MKVQLSMNPTFLHEIADAVRTALDTVDVAPFEDRLCECAQRRALIEATAEQARERLGEIVHEADDAERVGPDAYDEAYAAQQAPMAFHALMGVGHVSKRRSGAELIRERDQLRLALRGELAALNGVELAEQRIKQDARDAIAEACSPLAALVRDLLPHVATELAKLHAIAVVAAGVGQSRLEPALTEAMGHLRSFVGCEVPVPADLLAAFEGAGPLLALAQRQVPAVVHIRYPSTEIVVPRAA